MAKTMPALVKSKAEPGLWLEEKPIPEIGLHDVLIEIHKTAICGTDVHIYNWDAWASETIPVPLVIGHEFAGKVAAIGDCVTDLDVGDIVSGEGHIVCGGCRNCLAGRRHLCMNTTGVGIQRDGAYAQYLKIPITNVWHADPDIPMELLACFDPFGNAAHSALSFPTLGEDVLITGAGPIGCMSAAVAKHAGARHVVVTDRNPYRLALAEKLGATMTLDVGKAGIADAQKRLGMKEGFDIGLEMSGSPEALQDMLDNMCHGGKIALLGIPDRKMEVDWSQVVFNGLTLKGIYGREMYETWYAMTAMIQSGLDISPVITHRFPYSEYLDAFEAMRSGESGKVVMTWKDD